MVHLEIKDVDLSFGGVQALNKVNLQVEKGQLFSLIGPNGAGKTSLINCVSKFYVPDNGKIIFNGREITALRPYQVTRFGISRTFQNIELFAGMTVLDNVKLGRHIHLRSGSVAGMFYWGKAKREERELEEFLDQDILGFLGLSAIRDRLVAELPYGMQKRVDLARALASKPELLILDEPVAGMNREETQDLIQHILEIKKAWGLTVFLIEHDMEVVMNISDWIAVINFGENIAEGTAESVQNDPEVIRIYLGHAYGQDTEKGEGTS
jgi:branched-chain amino acid transport system ATP-binding protein